MVGYRFRFRRCSVTITTNQIGGSVERWGHHRDNSSSCGRRSIDNGILNGCWLLHSKQANKQTSKE